MDLNQILDKLDVEHNPKYLPKNGETFCNVYVHDVTTALGCPIPLQDASGKWLTANAMEDWLAAQDAAGGLWRNANGYWSAIPQVEMNPLPSAPSKKTGRIDQDTCRGLPDAPRPICEVATWKNPQGHGHIVIVLPPSQDGDDGIWISQAGQKNYREASIRFAFSQDKLLQVKYWVHP